MQQIHLRMYELESAGFTPVRIRMSQELHQKLVVHHVMVVSGKKIAGNFYNGLPVDILPSNEVDDFTIEVR